MTSHRSASAFVVIAALVAAAAGCGSASSPPSNIAPFTPPDLSAFLQLPVATPSSCPSNVSGTTDGRSSPWVGHVDVSVFLAKSATTRQILTLGNTLRADRLIQTVYFESKKQAYEEFQRLYTCWTSVPRAQAPASYRVVLIPTATFGARNALVARLARLPEVDTVSCDPSVSCVSVVEAATATPSAAASPSRSSPS